MAIVSDERVPDSDVCGQCKDAKALVLPNGEIYRVCAPDNWRNYECAAKQLVALKKPAAYAELPQPAQRSRRQ